MRKSIVAFVLTLSIFAFNNKSYAEDKDLLVGKWELNGAANNPDLERGYIVFRENGTGRLDRRADNAHLNFTWKMEGVKIRLTYSSQDVKYLLYRFEDTHSLELIPLNDRFEQSDHELYYYRNFGKVIPPKASAKKQVVGVWEAVVTANGRTCHNEIVLRTYGTGSNTTICGTERQHEDFHWELIDGNIVKFRENGTNARGRVRMIDKTNFTITAIDYYGAVMSPEIYYTKIFDNDEGC